MPKWLWFGLGAVVGWVVGRPSIAHGSSRPVLVLPPGETPVLQARPLPERPTEGQQRAVVAVATRQLGTLGYPPEEASMARFAGEHGVTPELARRLFGTQNYEGWVILLVDDAYRERLGLPAASPPTQPPPPWRS